jgi:hypothetical protein
MLTKKSATLLASPLFADAPSRREFGRQADHDSPLRRRSVGSLERLRILGHRLLAGHGFEDANIVLLTTVSGSALYYLVRLPLARFTLG